MSFCKRANRAVVSWPLRSSEMWPTWPKSIMQSWPSLVTMRFPGWGSAWKSPALKYCSMKFLRRVVASFFLSTPVDSRRARSPALICFILCRVRTLEVERSQ